MAPMRTVQGTETSSRPGRGFCCMKTEENGAPGRRPGVAQLQAVLLAHWEMLMVFFLIISLVHFLQWGTLSLLPAYSIPTVQQVTHVLHDQQEEARTWKSV